MIAPRKRPGQRMQGRYLSDTAMTPGAGQKARPSLVWLHRDLRADDNPALLAAHERGPVIPVFVWAPHEEEGWAPGAAGRWWLHQSLARLHEELARRGLRLILRQGNSLAELEALLDETGADTVLWCRRHEPALSRRDAGVLTHLSRRGVIVAVFQDQLLYEPGEVSTQQGKPYRMFTPFWKACQALAPPLLPQEAPARLQGPRRWPASLRLEQLGLVTGASEWADSLADAWQPGTAGAGAALQQFLKTAAADYQHGRNRPADPGTSRLSPHLHFGEISPRQLWHALHLWGRQHGAAEAVAAYQAELGWREFAYHLLLHFPHSSEQPLRPLFARFPWSRNRAPLAAWQQGRTGYPLVDAGMRQLQATGWMHNRVRMVAASFLVKDLLLPWQAGARWFWDRLVDADLASNTLNWQWCAGCGTDASPYIRVFHPARQSKRFDPEGAYIRRWVPELARLPAPWIHQPWQAPANVLAAAGIVLARTYPLPIVDHEQARERARDAFAALKRRVGGIS